VVFGAGNVGSQVIRRLVDQGVAVIAADRDPLCPNVAPMRSLGVAVEAGYSSIDQVLETIGADRAKLLFAVTDDDVANIECAILLQEARAQRATWGNRNAPTRTGGFGVLVRAFQSDFGSVLRQADGWDVQTVSAFAAANFAKALAGEKLYGELQIVGAPQTVVVAEISIDQESTLVGSVVRDRRLCQVDSSPPQQPGIVLMIIRQQSPWCEDGPMVIDPIRPHDRVVVLATREEADAIRCTAMGKRSPEASTELLEKIREIELERNGDRTETPIELAGKGASLANRVGLLA
jgi:Trk K+ transport system NAD-binding subunit